MNGPKQITGRGTGLQVHNRFEKIRIEEDLDQLDCDDLALGKRKVRTEYFDDGSETVVSENNSPDLPFRYSINPYRGCSHGCSYCYARVYHEFLAMSAGLDFETKIFVKKNAADLFRKWLCRKSYVCEAVNLSGITDPYQPAERHFKITRDVLKVALECRQPIMLITKNALLVRDMDLIGEMAKLNLIRVSISVTSMDQKLTSKMEPQTSSPKARLNAIRQCADNRVPVNVMMAPIVPGLTDFEIPNLLKAAADHGANFAAYTVLRMPGAVEPIFKQWLSDHCPLQKSKIESLVSQMRSDGQRKLNDGKYFTRMRGKGVMADQIATTFKTFRMKFGLDKEPPPIDTSLFRRPVDDPRQKRLFDG